MQSGIKIKGNSITGTLNYVTGYTGFSGAYAEQSGHYLALHVTAYDDTNATIKAELVGGTPSEMVLDSDRIAIFRITDTSQKIKITVSREGQSAFTKTYSLSGLTLK